MSALVFLWLFGSIVVTPLALYWRRGVPGRTGLRICRLVQAISAGACIAGAYFKFGGIA